MSHGDSVSKQYTHRHIHRDTHTHTQPPQQQKKKKTNPENKEANKKTKNKPKLLLKQKATGNNVLHLTKRTRLMSQAPLSITLVTLTLIVLDHQLKSLSPVPNDLLDVRVSQPIFLKVEFHTYVAHNKKSKGYQILNIRSILIFLW